MELEFVMRLPHSVNNLMPGIYFYFPPNSKRPIELVIIESLKSVLLRRDGDWVEHPYLSEVLDNLPEFVIFSEEAQAVFDLVDLAEREGRNLSPIDLRPFHKLF